METAMSNIARESSIDYQYFKTLLYISSGRVKKLIKSKSLAEVVGKILSWCQVSTSPEIIETCIFNYQKEKNKNIVRRRSFNNLKEGKPIGSLRLILRSNSCALPHFSMNLLTQALEKWFLSDSPIIQRIKPQLGINNKNYPVLLYVLIKDFLFFRYVLRTMQLDFSEVDSKISKLNDRIASAAVKLKKNPNNDTHTLAKDLQLAFYYANMLKSYDIYNNHTQELNEIAVFYSTQTYIFEEISLFWDHSLYETSLDAIVQFYQNKLIKELEKNRPSANNYREKLFKIYVKTMKYDSDLKKSSETNELALLRKMDSLNKPKIAFYRFSLILLWGKINHHFRPMIYKFVNSRTTLKSTQVLESSRKQHEKDNISLYDHKTITEILNLVLFRIRTLKKQNPFEYSRLFDQKKKYIDFKHLIKNITQASPEFKILRVWIVQSIIWDYSNNDLGNIDFELISLYKCVGKILDEEFELNILDFYMPLLSLSLSVSYLDKLQSAHNMQTDMNHNSQLEVLKAFKNQVFHEELDKELVFLIDLIAESVTQMDFPETEVFRKLKKELKVSYNFFQDESIEQVLAYLSMNLPMNNEIPSLDRIQHLLVSLEQESMDYSRALSVTGETLLKYVDNLNQQKDLSGFQDASTLSDLSELVCQFKEAAEDAVMDNQLKFDRAFSIESMNALKKIFNFYRRQGNQVTDSLSKNQFKLFSEDFFTEFPKAMAKEFFCMHKYMSHRQFLSIIDQLADHMFRTDDHEQNFKNLMQMIGCLDSTYKTKLRGFNVYHQSPQAKPKLFFIHKHSNNNRLSSLNRYKSIKLKNSHHFEHSPKHTKLLLRKHKTVMNIQFRSSNL